MRTLCCSLAGAVLYATNASAAPVLWTDWVSATGTSASGVLGAVNVEFTGLLNPVPLLDGSGAGFWAVNSDIYTFAPSGSPPSGDIIRLTGGQQAGVQTLAFSAPLTDPVLAILSLGQPGFGVSYDFDAPFDILNQGAGYFGGGPTSLAELPGDVLVGTEGHGIIRFSGTFTSISWTIPTAEFWHGFQLGVVDEAPAPAVPLPLGSLLLLTGLGSLAVARSFGSEALRL